MPGYYIVKILKINPVEASVKLHIRMFNPDGARIYGSVGFGLQLLDNGKWKGSLIGNEISFDDFTEPAWCQQYANGFVRRVEKIEGDPVVPPENDNDKSDPDYYPVDPLPTATMTIFVSDAAWLAHLTEGDEWESYAYEVARQYDACEPILYQEVQADGTVSTDLSEGWMPLPSFLFPQGSYRLPNVVYFPKYTLSSYTVGETMAYSADDPDALLALHGKYVKDVEHDSTGIFVWNDIDKIYTIFSISRGSRGGHRYNYPDRIEKIGQLILKPNYQRCAKWMNHYDIFRHANPVIKSVQRVGTSVTLEVTGIFDIDNLELNKARVLKLICNNFVETYNYDNEKDGDLPLSKLLKYFSKKEDSYPRDMLAKIADGIILKYSYKYPDAYIEDFESMDFAEIVDYFEKEQWPCFTFQIELSDAAFGLQLERVTDSVVPIELAYVGTEIEDWGKPILWKDYQELVD
ncbi:MAG: hypothetical protein AB8G22_15015 [Saprospiraceae bacterium]